MSHIVMAIALAQTFSPTIGEYLNFYLGWQAVFAFSLTTSTLITLLAVFIIPETSTHRSGSLHPFAVLGQYRELLGSRKYMAYSCMTLFAAGAYFTFVGAMPYVVVDLMGGTSVIYGNWFL